MKHFYSKLFIILILIVVSFLNMNSQICQYQWEAIEDLQNPDFKGVYDISSSISIDSSAIFMIGEDVGISWGSNLNGEFYAIKLDKFNCSEIVIKRHEVDSLLYFNWDNEIHYDNTKLYMIQFFSYRTPFNGDPQPTVIRPIALTVVNKSDLSISKTNYVTIEDYFFYQSTFAYLEERQEFVTVGSIFPKDKLDTFIVNPDYGFQFVKPAFFRFNTEGEVLHYKIYGEEEGYMFASNFRVNEEADQIEVLGGQLRQDFYPANNDAISQYARIDINTGEMLELKYLFENNDTTLKASSVFWDEDKLIFNGVRGTNLFTGSHDLEYYGVGEQMDGSIDLNTYKIIEETVGVKSQYWDDTRIYYKDTDSSYIATERVDDDPNNFLHSIDLENFWLLRIDEAGNHLDTIKIAHDIDGADIVRKIYANFDTASNELILWGDFFHHDGNVVFPPYWRYVFLNKFNLEEVLDLFTSNAENPVPHDGVINAIRVFPTVFEERIMIYNKGYAKEGRFVLLSIDGKIVFEEKLSLSRNQLKTINVPYDLASGNYFYQYSDDQGQQFTGKLQH